MYSKLLVIQINSIVSYCLKNGRKSEKFQATSLDSGSLKLLKNDLKGNTHIKDKATLIKCLPIAQLFELVNNKIFKYYSFNLLNE